uniref:Uncharacterized protein n=1 Tax=Trichuris muris TaxID=70415 RepID=A0A5S6Q710_TRIMR
MPVGLGSRCSHSKLLWYEANMKSIRLNVHDVEDKGKRTLERPRRLSATLSIRHQFTLLRHKVTVDVAWILQKSQSKVCTKQCLRQRCFVAEGPYDRKLLVQLLRLVISAMRINCLCD